MLIFLSGTVSDRSDSFPRQSFRGATSSTKFCIESILAKPLYFCLSMSFMLGSSDSFLKCAYEASYITRLMFLNILHLQTKSITKLKINLEKERQILSSTKQTGGPNKQGVGENLDT